MPNDKFAPSAQSKEICHDIVLAWKNEHQLTQNFDEATYQLASRVRSWIAPRSVIGGVQDVFAPILGSSDESMVIIDHLGHMLGQKLMDEGLLIASPKRSASLG